MTTTGDPITQISETTRRSAARVEALALELANLRTRLDGLDARVEGANSASLSTGERVESLRAEVKGLNWVEPALNRLQAEMASTQATQRHDAAQAVSQLQDRLVSEIDRLGAELGRLTVRVEALQSLTPRLDALERERGAVARSISAVDARVDQIAAERTGFQEELRRTDQRGLQRLEELLEPLKELQIEIDAWRGRIDQNAETVREVRTVADHMRAEVGEIRQEHHATAESQRVFEARVEGLLTAMRRESAEEWQRFLSQRDADWILLARANEQRDAAAEALRADLDAAVARLAEVEAELPVGLARQVQALAELRRDLQQAFSGWRESFTEATAIVEGIVGQGETAAALEERRQALRRTLRAQRSAREA
jgi:chromosome segregation ATPase